MYGVKCEVFLFNAMLREEAEQIGINVHVLLVLQLYIIRLFHLIVHYFKTQLD